MRFTFLYYKKNPQKIIVIYNGVDLAEYTCNEDAGASFRKRFAIADDTFLIGAVGRIFFSKGFHIAVKAVSEIKKRYKNVCLAIIGSTEQDIHSKYQRDDNYLAVLKSIISSLGLEKQVIFTGQQGDMNCAYQAIDLLVLPTLIESFGRVLIEAMSAEKPVVASAVGGIPEIVDDRITGLLVSPDDINGFTKAITKMLENEEDRRRMGKEGRRRVENMFSIEKNVEKTQQVYLKVLNRHQ